MNGTMGSVTGGQRWKLGMTVMALVGCGAAVTPRGSSDGGADIGPPPGRECTTSADCRTGEMCEWNEGACGVPGTCVPARPCTEDATAYCGCDGRTFYASSTCPERPYRHRGPCESVDAGGGTTCHPLPVAQARVARVLLSTQPLAFTVLAPNAGCACTPSVRSTSGSIRWDLQLCDCCEVCDCTNSYEVSVVERPLSVGHYELLLGNSERRSLDVVASMTSCRPIAPLAVRVHGPNTDWERTGPRLWWALVTGQRPRCCADPMPLVVQRPGTSPRSFVLDLYACGPSECSCPGPDGGSPPPAYVETWHSLGELAPGQYTVTAGSNSVSFTVP